MKNLKLLFLPILILFAALTASAQISITISANIAPPALPDYEQPACPVEGYLWVPGYWAYDETNGYYWVPGVWTAPPSPGLLWTPAYWGYADGVYGFHSGYWSETIGFYGGINYGYGYGGVGYVGGEWHEGKFQYNTAVTTVNTTVVRNTYVNETVINKTTVVNHSSFNGPGGIIAKPRPEEELAMRQKHFDPTPEQISHSQSASKDRSQFARVNGGHPAAAAMNKVNGTPVRETRPALAGSGGRQAGGPGNALNSAGGGHNTAPNAANLNRNSVSSANGRNNPGKTNNVSNTPARNPAIFSNRQTSINGRTNSQTVPVTQQSRSASQQPVRQERRMPQPAPQQQRNVQPRPPVKQPKRN